MMNLMPLANENIPVTFLNRLVPEFSDFDDDSILEVLEHEASPWLSNEKNMTHRFVFRVKDPRYNVLSTYGYLYYDQGPIRGVFGENVNFVDSYVLGKFSRFIN